MQSNSPSPSEAEVIRDRFFNTAIPKCCRATVACLAAGSALLSLLRSYGVASRLFSRRELHIDAANWNDVRDLLGELIRGVESLPSLPGVEPRRAKAVKALTDYRKALA